MHALTDAKILLVEDDLQMSESIRRLMGFHGFYVQMCSDLMDALDALTQTEYDLILLDLKLDGQLGFVIMDHLIEKDLDTRVVIITGCHSERFAVTALKKGAIDYLKKPVEPEDLLASVYRGLGDQKHQRERRLFENIVAASPEAILVGDHHGRIVYANTAYRRLLAPTSPEREECTPVNRKDNDVATCFDVQIKQVVETGREWMGQVDMIDDAGHRFVAWKRVAPIQATIGGEAFGVAVLHPIADGATTAALGQSFARLKALGPMLPICASCKKVRDGDGGWTDIETYLETHAEISFSHGICPGCVTSLYPELTKQPS